MTLIRALKKMFPKGWRYLIIALGIALVSIKGCGTPDQAFPAQPMQLVTPYPPGGSHSLHAGVITTVAEPYFGQPMVSVIRAGGGGVVGATEVAQGQADGYVMLFGDPTINSLRPQIEDLSFTVDSFTPVARINYAPAVFVAAANAPFDDLEGMIDYAKANPGELVYSSDNVNGFTYVVFEMLKMATGTEMKGIEFGGGGPAITQLLGGNTMAYAGAPSVVSEHIKAGKVKGICTTDSQRWESLPEVPTCQELGQDILFQFWRGVLVPSETSQERVEFLSDAFEELVQDEGFLQLVNKINSNVSFLGHAEFTEYLERERQQLEELYSQIDS